MQFRILLGLLYPVRAIELYVIVIETYLLGHWYICAILILNNVSTNVNMIYSLNILGGHLGKILATFMHFALLLFEEDVFIETVYLSGKNFFYENIIVIFPQTL